MTRPTKAVIVVAGVVLAAFAALAGYTSYWEKGAENAVAGAAHAIAEGRTLPGLDVEPEVAATVAAALRGGYDVVGFDNIGFGFRAYEVKVRVRGGDQYNFDAIHGENGWGVSCCHHFRAADLPK